MIILGLMTVAQVLGVTMFFILMPFYKEKKRLENLQLTTELQAIAPSLSEDQSGSSETGRELQEIGSNFGVNDNLDNGQQKPEHSVIIEEELNTSRRNSHDIQKEIIITSIFPFDEV